MPLQYNFTTDTKSIAYTNRPEKKDKVFKAYVAILHS